MRKEDMYQRPLTVKELVEALLKLDQDAFVTYTDDCGWSLVAAVRPDHDLGPGEFPGVAERRGNVHLLSTYEAWDEAHPELPHRSTL